MRRARKSFWCFPALTAIVLAAGLKLKHSGRGSPGSSDATQPHGLESSQTPLGFSPGVRPRPARRPRHTPSPCPRRRTPASCCAPSPPSRTSPAPPPITRRAVFVRDKLREWGWKAEIAELEVLLNYPE